MIKKFLQTALFLGFSFTLITTTNASGIEYVTRGQSAVINWSVTAVNSCSPDTDYPSNAVSGDSVYITWSSAGTTASGNKTFSAINGNPSGSFPQSYTFSCTNGTASDSATLIVDDCPPSTPWNGSACVTPPTASISQSSTVTTFGTPFTVSWDSTGATACTVTYSGASSGTIGSGTSGGPVSMNPAVGTYTATNACTNEAGTPASASINHTVTPAPCTLPWGGTIASGQSVTAYQSSSVVSPATCQSQTRTCTDGTLSGTYTNETCSVTATPILGVTVSPSNYSTQISGNVSATYTLTNGTSANTNCRLLDNTQSALTSYAECTSPLSFTAPSAAGTYGYYIQASQASTGQTAISNNFTVTVATAAPVVSLSASPTSIVNGNSSTLTRTVSGATSCSINQGMGAVTAANGTTSVSPSTTTTYTLSCTGAGGTSTASATVTVTAAAQPDLVASAASPAAAVVNSAVTLSATIQNQGSASTGASFNNFIQVASAANGGGTVTDLAAVSMSTLAAGTSNTTSRSHTFTTVGTYSIRACADKSSAGSTGSITESDETNNCSSAWTNVTVTAAAQPDLVASAVTPTTGAEGSSITLSATITNNGTGSTNSGGMMSLFQKANDASGTGAVDIGTHTRITDLPAGSSYSATMPYTLPTAGTIYVRACADKDDAASAGIVTESNENNNCGTWTAVTITSSGSSFIDIFFN